MYWSVNTTHRLARCCGAENTLTLGIDLRLTILPNVLHFGHGHDLDFRERVDLDFDSMRSVHTALDLDQSAGVPETDGDCIVLHCIVYCSCSQERQQQQQQQKHPAAASRKSRPRCHLQELHSSYCIVVCGGATRPKHVTVQQAICSSNKQQGSTSKSDNQTKHRPQDSTNWNPAPCTTGE